MKKSTIFDKANLENTVSIKNKFNDKINCKFKKLYFLLSLFFVCTFSVFAISADLKTVDTVVTCNPNTGLAQITVTLEWFAEDQMHGFDFMGEQAPLEFINDKCWIDVVNGGNNVNAGRRLPLTIKKSGSKYLIDLSDGEGFTGTGYFVLTYSADLKDADMVGLTKGKFTDSNGSQNDINLFYFHWAPVEWAESLDSRTVRVVFPIEVKEGASGNSLSPELSDIHFMTEEFVNKQNSIDWYGTKGDDGKNYLTLRFYQENVSSYQSQELQFYISAEALNLSEISDYQNDK